MLNKSRHLILTIYLFLLLITSLLTGIGSVILFDKMTELAPNLTKGLLYLSLFGLLIEFLSIYLIFKWKKIGFYGVIIAYLLNIYVTEKSGVLNISTIIGLAIRLGLLYGILQIKSKGISGWNNLTE